MAPPHAARKVVFTAAEGDLERVVAALRRTKHRSVSAFVRDAVHEKLERLRDQELRDAVARYCAKGVDDTDDILAGQDFEEP